MTTDSPLLGLRLHEAVSAACPGANVSVLTRVPFAAEFAPPAGATPAQLAAAQAAIDSFDPSAVAQAAWELTRRRADALASFFSRSDDTAIALRAWLTALQTLVNDRLEAAGQSRVTEADVLAFIRSNPTVGDPRQE